LSAARPIREVRSASVGSVAFPVTCLIVVTLGDRSPRPASQGLAASANVFDFDLSGDHLVSQRGHDRCDESEAILALVGDQDAQIVGLSVAYDRLYRDQV
jgi:hypothetical protein